MNRIISLTMYRFKYPISFEITGIKVLGTAQDINNRAIVNDIEVEESYGEIMYTLANMVKE